MKEQMQSLENVQRRALQIFLATVHVSCHFRAVVGGPAMAWPLFLPRIFFTILCLFKSSVYFRITLSGQPPHYDSTWELHGRTTFRKPTTALHLVHFKCRHCEIDVANRCESLFRQIVRDESHVLRVSQTTVYSGIHERSEFIPL